MGSGWAWVLVAGAALLPAATGACSSRMGGNAPTAAPVRGPSTKSPPSGVSSVRCPAPSDPDERRASYSLPDTEVFRLDSAEVGDRYVLYVSLPRAYASRSERFPVVLLLDADYSFALAHQIEQQLSDYAGFPELILVGIAYDHPSGEGREHSHRIHRTRDYTPVYSETGYPEEIQRYSGGAERFLAFIERELVPHIDRTYRTVLGDRTIVGHSYGALFATWAILTEPELFRRAVLVSPSYWYADHWIFGYEAQRSQQLTSLPVAIYIAVGVKESIGRYNMVADARRMVQVLSSRGYRGLSIRGVIEGREHHYSIFPSGLTTGLRYVFGKL